MMQEFSQQVEETARAVMYEIHTALPGTILSFEPENGTAGVKPDGKYITADGKKMDYPQITDVPVVFPFCQTAGIGMVFPVRKGDRCLIVISEVELDEWRSGAESEGSLRFDLTSAMCVPGLLDRGGPALVRACRHHAAIVASGKTEIMLSENAAEITSGTTRMIVSEDGVAISGNLKVDGNISSTKTVIL